MALPPSHASGRRGEGTKAQGLLLNRTRKTQLLLKLLEFNAIDDTLL